MSILNYKSDTTNRTDFAIPSPCIFTTAVPPQDFHPSVLAIAICQLAKRCTGLGKISKDHFRRSRHAFIAGNKSPLATAAYLLMILPLILAHGLGEFVGYRKGPGQSPYRLV